MIHTQLNPNDFRVSTGKEELDVPMIHRYLSQESYWAQHIPLDVVERAIENSMCFGVYKGKQQVGFARVITDYATFAYLADVFILSEFRGIGLSKMLLRAIQSHEQLQGLRRWMLATADAHGLYRQFGWEAIEDPSRLMGIVRKNSYPPTEQL